MLGFCGVFCCYHLPSITCAMRIKHNEFMRMVAFAFLISIPAWDCIASGCSPLSEREREREKTWHQKQYDFGLLCLTMAYQSYAVGYLNKLSDNN